MHVKCNRMCLYSVAILVIVQLIVQLKISNVLMYLICQTLENDILKCYLMHLGN